MAKPYSFIYREVVPDQTRPEKCKEFTLNTGGTPSTLQDIKVQQRAGGFTYKTHPDRFIYWRTNHDVLELVEQSLSVNLISNHVRYRFTDTPILEGVSIHENYNSIVILVVAVSSVHRLIFPHPNKIVTQPGTVESSMPSIFSEASLSAAKDPTSYHILASSLYLPHTATSCLTANGDAMFALALSTGIIQLVHLEQLCGIVTCKELHQDTRVTRLFSGLTDAILGRDAEDSVAVSLVLHPINNVYYLFGVCRDGRLRVWNCDKGNCLDVRDLSPEGVPLCAQGGQNHSIRKAVCANGQLYLCVFLGLTNGGHLAIVSPSLDSGTLRFSPASSIQTPKNHDLVEMWLGDKGDQLAVWCLWVTSQGETAISYSVLHSEEWVWASLQPPPPFERNLDPMIDPRQAYLMAIFEPGVFSVADINRALSIYRRSSTITGGGVDIDLTGGGDLRHNVCQAVEAEIQVEVSAYELNDDDYLEVADRCWSRFYSCCVQYLQTGTAALGLFWLPATESIVIIKKTGFSLIRKMDSVELLAFSNFVNLPDEHQVFFIDTIKSLEETEDTKCKIEAALNNINSLQLALSEAVAEIDPSITTALNALRQEVDESHILNSLNSLLETLSLPAPIFNKESESDALNSHLGISAIVTTLDQMVTVRLDICIKFIILLHAFLPENKESSKLWHQACGFCQRLWTLKWLCRAQFSNTSMQLNNISLFSHTDPLFLHRFILDHEGIAQSCLLNAASALAYSVWPDRHSEMIAEFLLEKQQYLLLQQFAQLVPHTSWSIIMAQAFLEMGEPYKAFDLVKDNTEHYFEIIQMFERHDLPDIVIDLADNIKSKLQDQPDHKDLPTLYSKLFLHHLKLAHWEKAYENLESNPDENRKINCLGQLVTELINGHCVDALLKFPFHGLLSNLELYLETRARSLDIKQAVVYYNALYAIHIKFENYKKAANTMYEHGLRSEACKAQFKCYGACLNALRLVEKNNAWIVKPPSSCKSNIELLELKDVLREYELSKARCMVKSCSPDTSAREVVAVCVSEGLYKIALRLCHLFQLGYEQPLEALTTACVVMNNQDSAWDWLLLNEISDLVVGDSNAGTTAWRLLEYLLLKYEETGLTRLHQVVGRKIMSHSAFLPHWLEASYKKRNPGELTRLYMRHGNLLQASVLSKELLNAALGPGHEYFSFANPLVATAPPLWLPINTIDRLLVELQYHPNMKEMEYELQMMLDKYIETVTRVSNDKIAAAIMY